MKWWVRLRTAAVILTLLAVLTLIYQVQHLGKVNTDQARKLGETRTLVDQLAACQSNAACMTALLKPFRQVVNVAPEPVQIVPIPGPPGRDGRDGRDGVTVVGPAGQNGQDGQDGKDAPTPEPQPTATVTMTATPTPEPTPTPTPTPCNLPPAFC